MIKYLDSAIVFAEIPDEITLAIEITGCPHKCHNCHSPQLRQDIGIELTQFEIDKLINSNRGISCVCFMGGDSCHQDIINLCEYIHKNYPNIFTAMYSGDDNFDIKLLTCLNYYKIGAYKEELGPLNYKTTNQHLYKIFNNNIEDITYKFWKEN